MPKILINKENNNVTLAKVNSAISSLETAKSIASSTSYPNGEYDWSSVGGQINDCISDTKKYKSNLENINDEATSAITEFEEDLSTVKITEIKKAESIVK